MDTFFVSVERQLDSRLKHKPILVGGSGDRGVVAACSYETRKFGIHSGMSIKLAKILCPHAITIKGDSSNYMKFSSMVTEIIQEAVPLFEKTSIDEFYADLTGMDKFFGTYKFSKELRHKIISHTGLPISFGLSENKIVSKVATGEAKPNNQMWINYGREKEFLSPLSIQKLPMIGKSTATTLRNLGIFQIGMLQQMPVELLRSLLGKNGITIWNRANGIDNSPVIQHTERKSISSERTFHLDTTDIIRLKAIITAMSEHLTYQLRNENKLTGCISIKIRYSDFSTYTKQLKIPYSSADHIILPKIIELFDNLYNRRLLVRLIGVRFSNLTGGHYQIDLFDDNSKTINLYKSLDQLRNKFGPAIVMKASTIEVKTVRDRRNPFHKEPMLYANRKR